ncbi:MAG: TonB-dependent receptor, partial [Bdellovibrionales bacterium]|nr:TonB-dependent receptor [Bdellovibrionales bacterium]
GGTVSLIPSDSLSLSTQLKWMGHSTEFDGSPLPAYVLLGEKVSYSPNNQIQITLGLDNLLDSRIEMIRGYPLPGRMAYASFEMRF